MRPCLTCGTPANGTRCPTHEQQHQASRNQRRTWYHGDWTRRSREARAEHLANHGPVCPGYQRPPHPVRPDQLTLDHVDPRQSSAGLTVLCRSCNSRKGGN